jgi:hypothetical protein
MVIEIIRTTLREWGSTKCNTAFFETLVKMLCEVKTFVICEYKASKYTFFLTHVIYQSKLGLKVSDLKNVTREGD